MPDTPHGLRIEHLDDGVLGLGVRAPRLSWWLPDGAQTQHAYRIEVDGVVHERVDSDASVLVPWPGAPLGSAQRATWRVQVWTDLGESAWSQPAWCETGLLDPADWTAQWIEPHEPVRPPAGARPAYELRTTFALAALPARARLYATAHGIYEAFVNGQRVGDLELTPEFTSYWANLFVQVHDVTPLLVAGDNELRVVLSDGWYRGKTGNWQTSDDFGDTVALLAQVMADGVMVAATSAGWMSTSGSIVSADLMDGQRDDRRIAAHDAHPVTVASHDLATITYSPAPPVRAVEHIRPVAITKLGPARQVVDLGQNINGRVRLDDLGPAGTQVTLVHGEVLDVDGDVSLANLDNGTVCVAQTDRVVSAGRAHDHFEPRHTIHGFQYVRVDGHPELLTPDDVTGVSVHTDLRRTGWFECSDERLNRFHEMADWSFRGNSCSVPTDCPTRERSGFTGDWQVFFPSAAFLYDVAGFSIKWLRDLAADQLDDGVVLNVAPEPRRWKLGGPDDISRYLQGSAGWGDAAVLVPWGVYQHYGDDAVLAELWPAMTKWVDFAAEAARTHRYHPRAAARPEPAAHEQYLWDGTFQWGEWCEPDTGGPKFFEIDQGHVATAFLHHSAALAARIGRLLGHDGDAARYDELATRALDAWRIEYVDADGRLTPDTQANHVRALAFGLVPDELRPQIAERLVALIRAADTHLGTGFLSTPYLLPVLADAGYLDVAYELLLQDTEPSWLVMVERGATTVWEEWNGIDEHGVAHASLNHYSKGAVISFLHSYVAGIQLLDDVPAYKRFRIAPQPGGSLTAAHAAHDSPYGRIESSWHITGDRFHLTATVPPGTTAEVVLPDGSRHEQAPGTARHESASPTTRSRR
jgi:alpha-L-rhamnosidase